MARGAVPATGEASVRPCGGARREDPSARERLLAAAMRQVSEKGYTGATTRKIAAAAGVSELTLFRQFGTKDGLFREMLKRHTFLPRLRKILADVEDLPCEAALRIIAGRYLETLRERRDLVKIMIAEVHTYPEAIRSAHSEFIAQMDATLAAYFAALQKKGTLRAFPATTAARGFLRMLFAHFLVEDVVMARGLSRGSHQRTVAQFVDLFLNGLAPSRRDGVASAPGGRTS